jgi:predicted kinase
MQKKYVFMMLGYLGSGKSYISRWLTPHIGAVHLRVDDLRLAMFGPDRLELYTSENKALVNNASQYAMEQILKSGQAHVVHDANHNARSVRRDIANKVVKQGGVAIVVWVQTPLEIAKRRAEIRRVTEGHELFEPNLVEKMAKRLEEPNDHELVITIDGEASAAEQQESFDKQWAAIKAKLQDNVRG